MGEAGRSVRTSAWLVGVLFAARRALSKSSFLPNPIDLLNAASTASFVLLLREGESAPVPGPDLGPDPAGKPDFGIADALRGRCLNILAVIGCVFLKTLLLLLLLRMRLLVPRATSEDALLGRRDRSKDVCACDCCCCDCCCCNFIFIFIFFFLLLLPPFLPLTLFNIFVVFSCDDAGSRPPHRSKSTVRISSRRSRAEALRLSRWSRRRS